MGDLCLGWDSIACENSAVADPFYSCTGKSISLYTSNYWITWTATSFTIICRLCDLFSMVRSWLLDRYSLWWTDLDLFPTLPQFVVLVGIFMFRYQLCCHHTVLNSSLLSCHQTSSWQLGTRQSEPTLLPLFTLINVNFHPQRTNVGTRYQRGLRIESTGWFYSTQKSNVTLWMKEASWSWNDIRFLFC